MFYPSLEEVKRLSEHYSVIPVCIELYADMETPISLFKRLLEPYCFLLESVEGGEKWARYSIIGHKPYITLTNKNGITSIIEKNKATTMEGNPVEHLREIMQSYTSPKLKNLPRFTGGAVGFIGYDIIRFYEDLPCNLEDDLKFPDCQFMVTDETIVYDHLKQKIYVIVNLHVCENIDNEYASVTNRIKNIQKQITDTRLTLHSNDIKNNYSSEINYSSNISKETFCKNVNKAKEYIKDGDIFQVVLSQRLEVETQLHPLEIYRTLRVVNPSPYMYYLNFEDFTIIGSSPETLVRVEDGIVETYPIAGTRPRGKTEQEDKLLEDDLLADEKERAEHIMLVDLARNDIGKISEFGSVEVKNFMHIERFSHVMHIATNVYGKLKKDKTAFDALASILPAGTVSGAPKVRAMQIIDELETTKRGPYAGSIGYVGFDGTLDMCITIRTILFKGNKAYFQAGAGIVADSVAETEYDETIRKASAMIKAIKEAGKIN